MKSLIFTEPDARLREVFEKIKRMREEIAAVSGCEFVRSGPASEPYPLHGGLGCMTAWNFDGVPLSPTAPVEDGQPQSNRESDLTALKNSVAAHQARCSCAPLEDHGGYAVARKGERITPDSAGHPWHIDPLCRPRPERSVEEWVKDHEDDEDI